MRFYIWILVCLIQVGMIKADDETLRPNVLFISVDDLNDWIGCLGGHPQALTPNFDRLAASGVLFTNAHCAAPSCNPSRTAVMTGISPHISGLYQNGQKMRQILPKAELLPAYFARHGYWSSGSGKMLHYFIDAQSWDDYYPDKESENPFPPRMAWGERPKSLPRGGPWQYTETDWHAFDVSDEAFGDDFKVAEYIGNQLSKTHDQPFFLACGIYRPHEPWFNPKKYFDLFPLGSIQLPPGFKENDLEDVPAEGKRIGPNRYFAHIQKQGQWKQAIQGYLASIAFADANLGRVLDALEAGPNKDNTIVILWSDHGWHLGEKQHWQKYTTWRAATRVPLMIRVPKGAPGLPEGTKPGAVCNRPVSLLDLFPTLTQLAGLPGKIDNDGISIIPLLKNSQNPWPHPAVTHVNHPGTFSLSLEDWRYIKYKTGGEELYHIKTDPYEWGNLAGEPLHQEMLEKCRALSPKKFAPLIPTKDESLPKLKFNRIENAKFPSSKPDGNSFKVVFANQDREIVKLFWSSPKGELISYGSIAPGKSIRQTTKPGAVWVIKDVDQNLYGYFTIGDRSARAVIPN